MAKLTLASLSNLNNQTSAVNTINSNSDLIEAALENTLSLDGTSPNSMASDLDLDSNNILNVGNIDVATIDAGTVDADNFTVNGTSLNILLLDWEGDWTDDTAYLVGNLVSRNGSSFICIQAHQSTTLNAPGGPNGDTFWDLVAERGNPGVVETPDTSTVNAVVRYADTLGNSFNDSGVLVSDTDDVTGVVNLTLTGDLTLTSGDIVVSGTVDGRDVATDGTKLDTIASGAEVNDTATEIRTKLLTVDGAGSGIDADLLDGVNGSSYYSSGGTDVTVADGGSGRSDATAYAVLCGGTTATGAHQSIASVGTSGQILTSNGAGALPTFQTSPASGITAATVQATTSGTTIDFSSLPTALRRITIIFDGVSSSGTTGFLVQIGDSGGLETTGYTSMSSNRINDLTSTSGFVIRIRSSAELKSGHMILTRITGNVWIASHVTTGVDISCYGGGTKTLSDDIDRVRITTVNGTDTFDAGQINITYE